MGDWTLTYKMNVKSEILSLRYSLWFGLYRYISESESTLSKRGSQDRRSHSKAHSGKAPPAHTLVSLAPPRSPLPMWSRSLAHALALATLLAATVAFPPVAAGAFLAAPLSMTMIRSPPSLPHTLRPACAICQRWTSSTRSTRSRNKLSKQQLRRCRPRPSTQVRCRLLFGGGQTYGRRDVYTTRAHMLTDLLWPQTTTSSSRRRTGPLPCSTCSTTSSARGKTIALRASGACAACVVYGVGGWVRDDDIETELRLCCCAAWASKARRCAAAPGEAVCVHRRDCKPASGTAGGEQEQLQVLLHRPPLLFALRR